MLERDGTFVSGEVGLPYIIQTMAYCEMNEKIIEFILKEKHPSYYAFVLAGETTLGEYWEDNPRSHNQDISLLRERKGVIERLYVMCLVTASRFICHESEKAATQTVMFRLAAFLI